MDGKGRPDLGRDLYEASAYIAHLEGLLHAIGAKRIRGFWHFPNYHHDGSIVLMTPERWVNAQKRAARLLSRALDADCDSTLSNVLPDLDGQNLTD